MCELDNWRVPHVTKATQLNSLNQNYKTKLYYNPQWVLAFACFIQACYYIAVGW